MGKCIAIHPSIANRTNVIYIIIHRKTGCVYVGQTTQKLKVRIRDHCNRRDLFVGRIIQLEGSDAFEVGVLDFCNSQKELNDREQFWIRYFNCTIPRGFNAARFGQASRRTLYCRRVLCLDNNTEYPSIAEAARQLNLNARDISAICNGRRKSVHGLRFVFVNNPDGELTPVMSKKRRVLCIETGEIYESITEAAKRTGLSAPSISGVCRGKCRVAGDLHFVFVDTPKEEWQIRRPQKRKVLCIENGIVYASPADASEQLGICESCIRDVCKGKKGSAGGMHFRFADIPIEEQKQFVYTPNYKPRVRRKVRCIDTGVEYSSLGEAARQLDLCREHIRKVCLGERKTTGGLHFEFVDD